MGRVLPVAILWWIGKQTEGGYAGGVESEGKVDRSRRMSWRRSDGDIMHCGLLMWVVSCKFVKSVIGR